MKANYGYLDGSGEYFITIDNDLCIECGAHACVDACPQHLFEIIVDDYDDRVAAIREAERKKLKYACAACKPVSDRPALPCVSACTPGAVSHSW